MLGRFDDDDPLGGQVAAQLGEDVGAQRLVARGDQHDLDALGFDQRAVAHVGGRAGQAGHHQVVLQRLDGALQIERAARQRADLAADPQRQTGAHAGIEGDAYRDRIPHRADRAIRDAALDQALQDEGRVARRATAGIVGAVGQHYRPGAHGQRFVERRVDVRVAHRELVAHGDHLGGQLQGQ